jgi:O-methyltransferase involved in polyketide biosynthesis
MTVWKPSWKYQGDAVNAVILSAVYDSRCFRFQQQDSSAVARSVQFFEVDAPGSQAAKLKALSKAKVATDRVTFFFM